MSIPLLRKDPDAELDYGFDWSDWLESGDEIDTSTWDVPAGITEIDDATRPTTHDGNKTKIWLSGGTAGETYRIKNTVVTDEDRKDDRSFDLTITEK